MKVGGPGLFGGDRYLRADQIAEVDGNTVRLKVRRDELPREA